MCAWREFAQDLIVDLRLRMILSIAVSGKFARAQRVINSFAGEWLDHARGIADQKKIVMRGRQCGAGERRDRAPWMIGWNREFFHRPNFKRIDVPRLRDQTKI